MLVNLIFTVLLWAIIIGFIYGLLKGLLGGLFERYGGFWGTLIAFAINAFEWAFLCWLVSKVIPSIDWQLGLILGPLYCLYCWIFNKENKFLTFWFRD